MFRIKFELKSKQRVRSSLRFLVMFFCFVLCFSFFLWIRFAVMAGGVGGGGVRLAERSPLCVTGVRRYLLLQGIY